MWGSALMAEFLSHTNPLRRLLKRWSIAGYRSGGGHIREFTSWLQPTVEVDRDWPDDDRRIWAYTADMAPTVAGRIPAIAIFSLDKEVLIRKVDVRLQYTAGINFAPGWEVNHLTPDYTYNPVILNAGQFFPFLQTGEGNTLSVPRHLCIGGEQTGLYQVWIGGVLVNPCIGPRYVQEQGVAPSLGGFVWPKMMTILDWDDPPIILPPYRLYAVQWHNAALNTVTMIVNLYTSEREVT